MLATDAAVRPGVAAVLFGDAPDDSVRGIDRQPAGSLKQRPIRLQPARRAPIWQPAVAHDDIGIGAGRFETTAVDEDAAAGGEQAQTAAMLPYVRHARIPAAAGEPAVLKRHDVGTCGNRKSGVSGRRWSVRE